MIRVTTTEETSASFAAADLTPLLDVVFIVMVFLLFTANVQTLSLPVNLPSASEAEAQAVTEPKTITLSILATGSPWAIEEQRFETFDDFSQALLSRISEVPELTVLVAGDRKAPLGRLVKLMTFLSEHDITAAQILMEEPKS